MKPNLTLTKEQKKILTVIENSLTPEMLMPKLRKLRQPNFPKVWGHCFIATEATYYLLGGKESGYSPRVLKYPNGNSHWWLMDENCKIIDPTAKQITQPFPYHKGKKKFFVANHTPSKRTRKLITIVKQILDDE